MIVVFFTKKMDAEISMLYGFKYKNNVRMDYAGLRFLRFCRSNKNVFYFFSSIFFRSIASNGDKFGMASVRGRLSISLSQSAAIWK